MLLIAASVLALAGVGILHACGGEQTTNCTPDESLCGDSCAALYKDPANCGACGHTCTAGMVCSQGSCATSCGGGTIQCGQSCVDARVDRNNCGSCNSVCPSGLACVDGACASTCSEGQSLCVPDGGAAFCAATQSDNANCGMCGNVCPVGQVCSSGACGIACSPGLTLCGIECVDTTSDLSNCGTCGTACGGTCKSGRCVVQLAPASIYANYAWMAVAGGYVYWSDTVQVYSAPTTLPTTTSVVDPGAQDNRFLGVAASTSPFDVYWLDSNAGSDAGGIRHLKGGPSLLVADPEWLLSSLAVDDTNLYWSEYDPTIDGGILRRASRDGGAPVTMIEPTSPSSIASDGTNLFWSGAGAILSLPVSATDAGSANTVVSDWAGGIAVDATNVYWVATGYVRQAPKGGGPITNLAMTSLYGNFIAVDASDVYFIDYGVVPTVLEKVPIGGGTIVPLVDGLSFKGSIGLWTPIAVDTTSVYVVALGGVYKVTPK